MSEHDEQCAVVEWFRYKYPNYKDCIISIPNGAHLAGDRARRARKMARLKKEGFKVGVSDLFIAIPFNGKGGLWIEMKDRDKTKRSVSEAQWDHLNLMRAVGYEAAWATGSEMAKQIIEFYLDGI